MSEGRRSPSPSPSERRASERASSESAATWARLEADRASGYWEEIARDLRRLADARLIEWLCDSWGVEEGRAGPTGDEPLGGCVFQARGHAGDDLLWTLQELGARSVSDEDTPPHVLLALDLPIADPKPRGDGAPGCAVLAEILGGERPGSVERLFLSLRVASPRRGLVEPFLPEALRGSLVSVDVLRSLHLETPFRLLRQRDWSRRRYGLQLLELARLQ